MKRYYLGMAATIHDPALAIIDPDGRPIFAEATERYLQCKRAYNAVPDDMIRIGELVSTYCEPNAELRAAVSWSTSYLSELEAMSRPVLNDLKMPREKMAEDSWPLPDLDLQMVALRNSVSQAGLNLLSSHTIPNRTSLRRYDHHLTHAANAAYTSPFNECVVAVVDGYGEWRSTAFYRYEHGKLRLLSSPTEVESASLGAFYGRLCALCGYDQVKGEEGKVMGLAPYGKHDPYVYELLRPLMQVTGLGLRPGCSEQESSRRWQALRKIGRQPGMPVIEMADLAYTGQQVFEEVMAELLNRLYQLGLSDNLALAGGVALNSSWNGRVSEVTGFKNVYVPSAPADDGNALGAAYLAYYEDHPEAGAPAAFQSPYLGTSLDAPALRRLVELGGYQHVSYAPDDLHERVAALLAEGKIVAWVQGRAEFGPRALGNRSIVADPRREEMKERINSRVKFREAFRPFAPSILDEQGPRYFQNYQTSPYMERTLRFRPEMAERVPSVVHVNGTGRLQSVQRRWNPRYYDLISAFYRRTDVPIVLNTSFNVMGKPIVHSVADAVATFFTTGLDAMAIEDYLLEK